MPSKIAFITGASKGIGRATALEAANSGYDVIISGRNKNDLENLQNEIVKTGQACYSFTADLNIISEIERLAEEIINLGKPLDLLVHSAGVAKVGKVADMKTEDWNMNIQTNLTAPFLLTQKVLPLMNKPGHIIFINSVAGRQSFAEWSSYCASKYGLKAFADCLRQEVAPQGIKVTTIYPAAVNTPMQDALPYDWDRAKMLKASEVAKAVLYCYLQPKDVQIKELDIENDAGTF